MEEIEPLEDPLQSDLEKLIADAVAKIEIILQPAEPIKDLIKLLQKSVKGVYILSNYKTNLCLTESERMTLSEIIIVEEIRSYRQLR